MPDTVGTALARALDALDGLQERGEDIDDEWTYVNDLAEAWRIEGRCEECARIAVQLHRRGTV